MIFQWLIDKSLVIPFAARISLTGTKTITASFPYWQKVRNHFNAIRRKLNESGMVFYAIINKKEVGIYVMVSKICCKVIEFRTVC